MFVRGDVNDDGALNVADAIAGIYYIFGLAASPPTCLQSVDADDSGDIDLADPIYILQYLFVSGSPPKEPFPECGWDTTPDALTCESYPPCVSR